MKNIKFNKIMPYDKFKALYSFLIRNGFKFSKENKLPFIILDKETIDNIIKFYENKCNASNRLSFKTTLHYKGYLVLKGLS